MVELGEKGTQPVLKKLPLHPLRDVRRIRGTLEEVIGSARSDQKNDYVSITLTDEIDPYKPKEQLEKVYSHILEIRMDNERTRRKLEFSDDEIRIEDPLSAFADFYREMQGRELSGEEQDVLQKVFDDVKGEA